MNTTCDPSPSSFASISRAHKIGKVTLCLKVSDKRFREADTVREVRFRQKIPTFEIRFREVTPSLNCSLLKNMQGLDLSHFHFFNHVGLRWTSGINQGYFRTYWWINLHQSKIWYLDSFICCCNKIRFGQLSVHLPFSFMSRHSRESIRFFRISIFASVWSVCRKPFWKSNLAIFGRDFRPPLGSA